MVDDLIDAVALAVRGALGEGVAIYDDPVEQGLRQPCVVIQRVSTTRRSLIGDRAYLDQSLDLVYLTKGGRRECEQATLALIAALRFIATVDGNKLVGFDLRSEVVDGVPHVFVRYCPTVHFAGQPSEPDMRDLQVRTGITKEE